MSTIVQTCGVVLNFDLLCYNVVDYACSNSFPTRRSSDLNVGLLLRGIEKNEVERGQVIAKPASITPHKKFRGEVYVLSDRKSTRLNSSHTVISYAVFFFKKKN